MTAIEALKQAIQEYQEEQDKISTKKIYRHEVSFIKAQNRYRLLEARIEALRSLLPHEPTQEEREEFWEGK